MGPIGPFGPQGDQGVMGIRGLTGITFITPEPTLTAINLTWATDSMILLNVSPSNPTMTFFERHSNEIILTLPSFMFNQDQNASTDSYILKSFLPMSIRPTQTYHQPILLEDGTICLMILGPTTIQIHNGINQTDLFPVNQAFTLASNQTMRYLL